jgi:hypothetical protein
VEHQTDDLAGEKEAQLFQHVRTEGMPDKPLMLTKPLARSAPRAPAQQRMIDIAGWPRRTSPTAGMFCSALGNLVAPTMFAR